MVMEIGAAAAAATLSVVRHGGKQGRPPRVPETFGRRIVRQGRGGTNAAAAKLSSPAEA